MSSSDTPAALALDPLRFVGLCWPEMRLYDKQQEVLLSVRDNLETFVPAANEMGKTRIAAITALWFFASRTPARVVTSSSSEAQLSSILWSELLHLIRSSRVPLPFVTKHLSVSKLVHPHSLETMPLDYLVGHVTNTVESFQGHHLENDKPRVLAIFDEASGILDEFFDAADSWAHRKLVVGNPLSNSNFFYRLSKAGDAEDPAGQAPLLRKVIHIGGRDSPNVKAGLQWKAAGGSGRAPVIIPGLLSYDDFLRRQQIWDEVKQTTRLYGRFYEGALARLVPDAWLDRSMDARRWQQLNEQPRRADAMGIDVAAGGRDKTCWTLVDRFGVVEQHVMDLSNTMEIAGRTIELMTLHDIAPESVAIDAGGGGKQIADRLIEQGHWVNVVWFGASADAKQAYKNRRAELYGELRELLKPDGENDPFVLPPDSHELRAELAILPLSYDSEGRQVLPPKDRPSADSSQTSIRQLLGRSPDRADSLVLAIWMRRHPAWDGTIQGELLCSGEPGDNIPFTDEEVQELPDHLRDLVETSREMYAERMQEREDEEGWRDVEFWTTDSTGTLFNRL